MARRERGKKEGYEKSDRLCQWDGPKAQEQELIWGFADYS